MSEPPVQPPHRPQPGTTAGDGAERAPEQSTASAESAGGTPAQQPDAPTDPTAAGRHAAEEPEPTVEPSSEQAPPAEPAPPPAPAREPNLGIVEAAPAPRRHTRRWFVIGAAAVVAGGAAGVGGQYARTRSTRHHARTPAPELLAAAQAERRLIADLDATTGGGAEIREVLDAARANHAAHLRALQAAIAAGGVDPTPSPSATAAATGTPRTAAYLRAAEQGAARASARRADSLHGSAAALLASIAACEATHAELLQ